jgi:UDP-N-acetylglucosamine 2-epimerase
MGAHVGSPSSACGGGKKNSNAPWLLCTGTRPEIIKMAPVYRALRARGERALVVHTATADGAAWPLYRFFGMRPECELVLEHLQADLRQRTDELLTRFGEVMEYAAPCGVLVHGSTLGAFAAASAASSAGIAVSHVEAGSYSPVALDSSLEEKNRARIARLASLHFAPTQAARVNLLREGIDEAAIVVSGSTAVDATRLASERLRGDDDRLMDGELAGFLDAYASHRIVLVSAPRHESLPGGNERVAAAIARILSEHEDVAIVWPGCTHSAAAQSIVAAMARMDRGSAARLIPVAPLEYPALVATLLASWIAMTDSDVIQEVAVSMGVPILVLRTTTSRPEIVDAGYARLVGTDGQTIAATFELLRVNRAAYAAMRCAPADNPFGDGRAAERIATALLQTVCKV